MGNHAFLSPSSAHIAYRCPASALRSFQMEQRMELFRQVGVEFYGLTESSDIDRLNTILEEDSEMADEGTELHTIFETALNNDIRDKSEILKLIDTSERIRPSTKQDVYITNQFYNAVVDQLDAIQDCDWLGVEHRVKVKGLPQFGTVDLTWLHDQTLYVRDLKTGYNEVSSEENEQLMTYAVGILDELGWEEIKQVKFKIIGVRWQADEWACSTKKLNKFKHDVMLPAFMEAYSINPKALAGDHCRYCSAKIHCNEWQEKFSSVANETFESLDMSELNSDELVSLFKLCKQAEHLAKYQLSPEILHRFEGFDVPKNIKRVSGAKVEKWTADEETIVKELKSKVGNEHLLYTQELLSPKNMKIAIGDNEVVEKLSEKIARKPYLKI